LLVNKLLNKTVLSKIDVTNSQIRTYYNENTDQFNSQAGEIRARHILVATEEEAEEILIELKQGADFSELAKLKSIDANSAVNGGDLGFFSKGQMIEEFEEAAFKLRVGQLSPVVPTQYGYHIIKREPDAIPYSEARDQIKEILLTDLYNNAIDLYIEQLRLDSTIVVNGIALSTEIETFTKTQDTICKENGKVIIRLFSTTKNPASKWISSTFDDLVAEYGSEIAAYHWQLDTGDNTLTAEEESGIPKEEVDIFQKYNQDSTVPTYVFGCKYVRIGNSYETLDEEEAEFKRVIEKLLI
jgi:hypothetical protein